MVVRFGNNLDRQPADTTPETTINDFIRETQFDVGTRSLVLNGVVLTDTQRDMTFAQLGASEGGSLLAIARKDNA